MKTSISCPACNETELYKGEAVFLYEGGKREVFVILVCPKCGTFYEYRGKGKQ